MNLKELEQLMKLCHKHNVKQITVGDVSISIETLIPPKQKLKEKDVIQENQEPQYTEEDILMWSAGQL